MAAVDDPELPVKVQAVMALTEMVVAHEAGTCANLEFCDAAESQCNYS